MDVALTAGVADEVEGGQWVDLVKSGISGFEGDEEEGN